MGDTNRRIRVFECFCRLEVSSNVKDRILVESKCPRMQLIVGWTLFAFRRNSSISFLLVSHTDMTSSINLFQKMGLMLLCLSISFSILAMKMLAKATAIFVPMAVPWV